MSNPRFYAGELAAVTFTMSATENASFPLSNLSNYVPSDVWKSSALTANQTLKIDFGSALARDSVVIDGHNFNAIADVGVYLQYDGSDDPAFSNAQVAATLSGGGNGRLKFVFASQTKRYWRIIFSSAAPLSDYPYVGNVFVAKEVDVGFTYIYPYSTKNEDTPSSVRRAVSGIARSTRVFGAVTKFKIVFDVLPDTFRTAWLRFHQKVIGKTPFYFYDTDDSGWYVFFTDPVDVETFTYDRNRTTELNMETQGVGQNPL
jgi:hypothetical protein